MIILDKFQELFREFNIIRLKSSWIHPHLAIINTKKSRKHWMSASWWWNEIVYVTNFHFVIDQNSFALNNNNFCLNQPEMCILQVDCPDLNPIIYQNWQRDLKCRNRLNSYAIEEISEYQSSYSNEMWNEKIEQQSSRKFNN